MSDEKQVRPFDSGSGPTSNADEESLRNQWQSGDSATADQRKSQARRLISRRPLLKGLGAGAGLLLASAGELGALLSGVTPAYAAPDKNDDDHDDHDDDDDDDDKHKHHRTTTRSQTTTIPTSTPSTSVPG